MPYQVTRAHEIHCGHRVCDHEGESCNLHGHAYIIHFTCEADSLDPLGQGLMVRTPPMTSVCQSEGVEDHSRRHPWIR